MDSVDLDRLSHQRRNFRTRYTPSLLKLKRLNHAESHWIINIRNFLYRLYTHTQKKKNNDRKQRLTRPFKTEHTNLCYTIVLNSDHSVVKFTVYESKRFLYKDD